MRVVEGIQGDEILAISDKLLILQVFSVGSNPTLSASFTLYFNKLQLNIRR
jgi:hypothetical protein